LANFELKLFARPCKKLPKAFAGRVGGKVATDAKRGAVTVLNRNVFFILSTPSGKNGKVF
jgi:hypothetical protein